MHQLTTNAASRCKRQRRALLATLALAGVGAGASIPAQAEEPSYTFHSAITGIFADTVDMSAAPIKQDVIVFYEHTLGRFPRIDLHTGEHINGGIPHLGDLNAHFAECLRDFLEQIPDPDWDGFAVIDYESWTPWWGDTTLLYRTATIEAIQSERPELEPGEAEDLARRQYEHSARAILEGTIQIGQAIRPNAKWGFWAYPKSRHEHLENAQWMWDACDAFYPEIYMQDFLVPDDETLELGEAHYSTYIDSTFDGNIGFARTLAGDSKQVLAFAWPRYGHRNENQWLRLHLLELQHLRFMLSGPYFWDADGVILWDSIPQQGLADVFQEFFDAAIGPEMIRMTDFVIEQDQLEEENRIPEDVNDDGNIDAADLSYVLTKLGTNDPIADINGDGIVDAIDMTMVLNAYSH